MSDGATSGPTDAAPADAAGIDPATCPVGVADGCCPLGQAYGGQDPDCPTLACAHLASSDVIPLDDWQSLSAGGIGMAWTGRELDLAWSGARMATANTVIQTITDERRDGSGDLAFGPVTNDDGTLSPASTHSQAELGFDPSTHALLFTSDWESSRYAELLGANGTPASTPVHFGTICNPIGSRHQVYPGGGGFLVAQYDESCSGTDFHGPEVDRIALDGSSSGMTRGDETPYVGMAFDRGADRILFTGGETGLAARWFDPPATWATPFALSANEVDESGAAFDGTDWAVTYGHYTFDGSEVVSSPTLAVWSLPAPPAHPTSSPETALVPTPEILQVPPRILWTGDGWIVVSTVYPSNGMGLPDSWSSFVTWVSSVAPDGTLRETFQLDDAPAYLVNAVWAGGRVAITWVTTDGQHERHDLRWLSCP